MTRFYPILIFLIINCLHSISLLAQPDTIPFALNMDHNIIITCILNDTDSVDLMLHTAVNDVSLIYDSTTLKMPSIMWDDSTDVRSWGGKTQSMTSSHNTLTISSIKKDSLKIWASQYSGHQSDGKFGLNLFENKVVSIHYTDQMLIISDDLPKDISQYQRHPIENKEGLYFISLDIIAGANSYQHQYLIHSGYGGGLLLDDQYVADHHLSNVITVSSEQVLKDSYGNEIITKKGTTDQLIIGSLSIDEPLIGFFEGAIGRQKMSVLGCDILRRFDIIFDGSREYIYLRRN